MFSSTLWKINDTLVYSIIPCTLHIKNTYDMKETWYDKYNDKIRFDKNGHVPEEHRRDEMGN
jgi:hypothetical protein